MEKPIRSLLSIFATVVAPSFVQAEGHSLSERLTNEGMTITYETFSDMPIHEMSEVFQLEALMDICGFSFSSASFYLCADELRRQGGEDFTQSAKFFGQGYPLPELQ